MRCEQTDPVNSKGASQRGPWGLSECRWTQSCGSVAVVQHVSEFCSDPAHPSMVSDLRCSLRREGWGLSTTFSFSKGLRGLLQLQREQLDRGCHPWAQLKSATAFWTLLMEAGIFAV